MATKPADNYAGTLPGASRNAALVAPFWVELAEIDLSASAATVTWYPYSDIQWEPVEIEVVVTTQVAASVTAPTIIVGTNNDDNGYVTVKTIPTGTTVGSKYNFALGTLTRGALYSTTVTPVQYGATNRTLTATHVQAVDGSSAAGKCKVRVLLKPVGPDSNSLYKRF